MSGHRVVLGVEHVPQRGGGGEAGRFVALMVDLADRAPGVSAFVADGALRGTHIARVQSGTGCPVVSPARRRSKQRGGIVIGKYGHAAAQLPPSRARMAWIDQCGGRVLYAAGGTIYERVVTADGTLDFVEVTRHQTKRDRKSDGTWAFYARHTLICAFCNRRLPAWGLHNQTVIVLMAALAQNAWARHTW